MSVRFSDNNGDDWDWRTDPERWAKHRSRFIECTTEFDTIECKIIAWAEIGRSHHGIAKQLDVSKGTVISRMSGIDEQFDCEYDSALWTRWPENIAVQSPVGIDGTVWGGDDD